jgi:hypothetical protein
METVHYIDEVIKFLQHPFYMMLGGLSFFFLLKWSGYKNGIVKLDDPSNTFYQDQKDEMVVSLVGGLLYIVWDDEILSLIYLLRGKEIIPHLQAESYTYFLIGPVVERLYRSIIWVSKKRKEDA